MSHSATLTAAYNSVMAAWSGGNHRLLNVLSNHTAPPTAMCNTDTFAPSAEPAPSTDAERGRARTTTSYSRACHRTCPRARPTRICSTPWAKWTWQREATGEYSGTTTGLYVFGFGHLVGDIGYVESDRNPFLHGQDMCNAPPFETEVISISGSTPTGVALAAQAFVSDYLVNGARRLRDVVHARGHDAARPQPDPGVRVHATHSAHHRRRRVRAHRHHRGAEDEYRGVYADTLAAASNAVTYEPLQIVRGKYYENGSVWTESNAGCASTSFECKVLDQYATGLHRRAYGNTIWAAQYKSSADAQHAATAIAAAAGLPTSGAKPWVGTQPPYESGVAGAPSQNALALWTSTATNGAWVYMSTLPSPAAWVGAQTWP